MTSRTYILLVLIVFLAGSAVSIALVHDQLHQKALENAASKATLLLEKNLATHAYFTEQLKPSVFRLMANRTTPDYFDPSWMSSTYAVREISNRFNAISDSGYYYKECAIDARSSSNEADAYERGFLEEARNDPAVIGRAEIRAIEGQPYYVVLRRGETMEQACLKCHSTPEAAPAELVKSYGAERSFHRRNGELVSAVSIRIPLGRAFAESDRFSLTLSAILLAVFLSLCTVLIFISKRQFIKPLNVIRQHASDIARDPARLGTEIPSAFSAEWNELVQAFNLMSTQLKAGQDELEKRVRERTESLFETNLKLQDEIARHQKTMTALEQSEEHFRVLYQKAPISYQSLDDKGNFIEINNTWLETLGYDRSEVIGRNFCEFIDPEWKAHFQENFPRFKAVGEVLGAEFEMIRKDGAAILASFNGRIEKDAAGGFRQTHCVFRNITEQREAEEERKRLEAQLRQAQKMEALGTLSGGIAHDFNNILAAIIGYTEIAVLNNGCGLPNRQELEQVLAAAQRAKKLVQQILTFSRRAETESRPVDVNREVYRTIDLIKSTLPRMIGIHLDLDGNLKKIRGDASQLGQILLNLAANARDAMPDGGTLTVATRNEKVKGLVCQACGEFFSGEHVTIGVSDKGAGISPGDLKRIFDPFFTTKETGKGTGLGLSIVYGIVKSHGGHICCASTPGEGSRFDLYFPCIQDEQEDGLSEDRFDIRNFRGSGRILLVDDEEMLRRLGENMLSRFGYEVMTAATGEDALSVVKHDETVVDLVILDVSMPGMGGKACLKRLLEIKPDLKIIMASGYPGNHQLADFSRIGARGYLSKPFTVDALIETVNRVIDSPGCC